MGRKSNAKAKKVLKKVEKIQESDAETFIVEKILDKKYFGKTKKTLKYLVKWEGYDAFHNSWEPSKNLSATCQEVIEEYEESKKGKISQLLRNCLKF